MHIDFAKIIGVVQKGVNLAHTLIAAGKEAGPAITAVKNLVDSAKGGTVTHAQIASTEETLDALIEDFNEPMD